MLHPWLDTICSTQRPTLTLLGRVRLALHLRACCSCGQVFQRTSAQAGSLVAVALLWCLRRHPELLLRVGGPIAAFESIHGTALLQQGPRSQLTLPPRIVCAPSSGACSGIP